MRKIRNPYVEIPGYQCFGCAPNHPFGLKLDFFEEGEKVVTIWQPEEEFQGFGNILHGGIHATLHDEVAAWALFVKCGTSGMTTNLNMSYSRPAFTHQGALRLEAVVASVEKNLTTLKTTMYDSQGRVCSEAEVVYFTYPEKMARKKLHYPGREAF